MRTRAAAILSAWDAGRSAPTGQRPDRLWAWVAPDLDPEARAGSTIGTRDRALLDATIALFGAEGECRVACSRCAEQLEFPLTLTELQTDTGSSEPFEVSLEDWKVRARVPTCGDLAGDAQPDTLLARCVLSVQHEGQPAALSDAPGALHAAIEQGMSERDPQADLQFQLQCPACEHAWTTTFDPATWLWTELEGAAHHLFAEIDLLARVYHWSEPEILALPDERRRRYVELAAS